MRCPTRVPLVALLALLLGGCAARPTAAPLVVIAPPASRAAAAPETVDTEVDLGSDAAADESDQDLLDRVWRAHDPGGTGAQIALRFLQALQRGDDVTAEMELTYSSRFELSFTDLWTLHRVMTDVRRNAGLADAGPCSHAARLAMESAVVTCGRRHVVVHVPTNSLSRGVDISDWFVHYDVYRGQHTHAFTAIEP